MPAATLGVLNTTSVSFFPTNLGSRYNICIGADEKIEALINKGTC